MLSLSFRKCIWLKGLMVILMGLTFGVNFAAQAETNVGGRITENETWTPANSPYILQGTVSVGNAERPVTLTVEAGVEIQGYHMPGWASAGTSQLHIDNNAALKILGTAEKKVRFTKTDRFGEDEAYWAVIFISSSARGAECTINHAIFEYGGGYGGRAMLEIKNEGVPTISNSTFQYSHSHGIFVDGSDVKLNNCVFSQNSDSGIFLQDSYASNVSSCTFKESESHVAVTLRRAYPTWENNTASDDRQYISINPNARLTHTGVLGFPGTLANGAPIPYVLHDSVGFGNDEQDITLTIEAGVEIQGYYSGRCASACTSQLHIENNAALKILGTAEQKVKFTKTERFGEDEAYWAAIFIGANARGSECAINHAIFEYGGQYGASAMLELRSEDVPTISNSTFQYSNGRGIFVDGGNADITNCKFLNNDGDGIHFRNPGSNVKVNRCELTGNGDYGMFNETSDSCVDAKYNDWGAPSGPLDDSDADDCAGLYNPGGKGEKVSDGIIYSDWGGVIPAPKELVGYWNFNEGSGDTAYDSSGKGNDGVVHGADWVDNGSCGKALSFDGIDAHVEILDDVNLAEYTIEAWVYPDEVKRQSIILRTDETGPVVEVGGKPDAGNFSHQLLTWDNGWVEHYLWDSTGTSKSVFSATTVVAGNWYHVAGVATSDGMMRLYVNGKEEGEPVAVAEPWTAGNRYLIGHKSWNGESFRGLIDEVRIYNYALSQAEIQADMNRCTPTTPPSDGRKLIIPELTAAPGDTITVPITITDATGVAGADIVVTYDKNVLTVEGDEIKTTTLSSGMNLISNTDTPGEIVLSMASTKGITSGSGTLIDIVFTVSPDAEVDTETPLTCQEAEVYDELGQTILIGTQNGKITIGPACIKGDVNGDGKIRSNDAILALRIAAGLMTPTPQQECAADINEDGKIRSNDAILILRKAAGLGAPGKETTVFTGKPITVMFGEAHGIAGESITVPLKVDNVNELAGGDIYIGYDRTVLRAVKVSSDADILLTSNIAEPGRVRIAFASPDSLRNKTVVEIQFDIIADDVSPLTLQRVELYQPNAHSLISQKIDGQFSSWAIPPERSALLQNFPNPFNPETWIPYQLAKDGDVMIRIYNVKGQIVKMLALGYQPLGVYTHRNRAAYWDGADEQGDRVASGVYFYQLHTGKFAAMRKLILVK